MSDEKRGESFVMKGPPQGSGAGAAIDFTTFLLGLASSALIHLGLVPHPEGGQPREDLAMARQSLDLLSLLREKTRGNLTTEEDKFFETLLSDLRLKFVEASKR